MNQQELASATVLFDLTVPSRLDIVEQAVELVKEECLSAKIDPRSCSFNIRVAVSEALANAINRPDARPDHPIRIRGLGLPGCFVIEIHDQGCGFPPGFTPPDPTTKANLHKDHGRGLFLIHALMDEVENEDAPGHTIRMSVPRRPGSC